MNKMFRRSFMAMPKLLAASAVAILAAHSGVQAQDSDRVVIGVSTPQSGGGADYGTAFLNGARLAVEELGGKLEVGGKTVNLQISACDDEFKSDRAASCARQLVSQDGAIIVLNPGTYATVPMLSFNQDQENGFLVLGASGDPAVTNQGNELFVRTWANATRTMPAFVEKLLAYDQAKSAGLDKTALMEVNSDFGAAWIGAFKEQWTGQGKEVVAHVTYDQNATDFYAQLTPLIAGDPDLIVMTTVCEPSSLVIRQARELNYQGTFLNHGGCTGDQMLKLLPPEMVEGMLFESAPLVEGAAETTEFSERYREAFGVEPQIISAVGYLDVMWLARAMQQAGTATDPRAIRAAMPEALDSVEPNLLGWAELDEAGDISWPMQVTYIEGGETRMFSDQ